MVFLKITLLSFQFYKSSFFSLRSFIRESICLLPYSFKFVKLGPQLAHLDFKFFRSNEELLIVQIFLFNCIFGKNLAYRTRWSVSFSVRIRQGKYDWKWRIIFPFHMIGQHYQYYKVRSYLLHHTMSKNTGQNVRWQNYESMRPGGSLIVNYAPNHHTGLSPKPAPKFKLEDLYRQPPTQHQQLLTRYGSDDQFKRYNARPSNAISPGEEAQRLVPEPNLKKGNSKEHEKESGYFKARNSGGRTNQRINFKDTVSTSSTEQHLITHKSEKMLPSFIRNQTKSPDRLKVAGKGLCRDSFKIIRRLGQGKFGSVSLARQLNTGMIVALKMMDKRKIIQDNLLVQFVRELKIQSFLQHPNIIKAYGYFADEQYFYTVLELGCDGQLYDIIANGQKLTEQSTSFIIGNLLDAVALMHKHKILHRDIKPQNIVLVHGNVKLCDFGWAVNKKEQLRSTFCGTPLYLSPELLQGERYDQKVDLWAVGVLAYQLVFGVSPFNISQQQDLVKIVTDDIEFPAARKTSKEFRDFIIAILKKNPKERLPCKDLLSMDFIKKYRDLQTCEELCQ